MGADIFQWAYERVALNRIVRNLNEMGIPAPSHYKKTTGEITSPGLIGSGKWQTRTVMKILERLTIKSQAPKQNFREKF